MSTKRKPPSKVALLLKLVEEEVDFVADRITSNRGVGRKVLISSHGARLAKCHRALGLLFAHMNRGDQKLNKTAQDFFEHWLAARNEDVRPRVPTGEKMHKILRG